MSSLKWILAGVAATAAIGVVIALQPDAGDEWDRRFANAVEAGDCEAQTALLGLGFTARYGPAFTGLADAADAGRCGYVPGQFSSENPRAPEGDEMRYYAMEAGLAEREFRANWAGRLSQALHIGRSVVTAEGALQRRWLNVRYGVCNLPSEVWIFLADLDGLDAGLARNPPSVEAFHADREARLSACAEAAYPLALELMASDDAFVRTLGVDLHTTAMRSGSMEAALDCLPYRHPVDDADIPAECLFMGGPETPFLMVLNGIDRGVEIWFDSVRLPDSVAFADPDEYWQEFDRPIWVAAYAELTGKGDGAAARALLSEDCQALSTEIADGLGALFAAPEAIDRDSTRSLFQAAQACEAAGIQADAAEYGYSTPEIGHLEPETPPPWMPAGAS